MPCPGLIFKKTWWPDSASMLRGCVGVAPKTELGKSIGDRCITVMSLRPLPTPILHLPFVGNKRKQETFQVWYLSKSSSPIQSIAQYYSTVSNNLSILPSPTKETTTLICNWFAHGQGVFLLSIHSLFFSLWQTHQSVQCRYRRPYRNPNGKSWL